MQEWTEQYLRMAAEIAEWSPHRDSNGEESTGCVIYNPKTRAVLSCGFDDLAPNLGDLDAFHRSPYREAMVEHAVRRAIYHAARYGIRLDGMGMAVNGFLCPACARAVIETGLTQLIVQVQDWTEHKWSFNWSCAIKILEASPIHILWEPKRRLDNKVLLFPDQHSDQNFA